MILRKIIKIVGTRCHILKLKCTKFDFGWGSALDPAEGAYSAPPDSLAGFKRPTSKGRREEGREGGDERTVERTRLQGRAGEGVQKERGREGRDREKGGEGIGKGEGKWGSPTHHFLLKSCTVIRQLQNSLRGHYFSAK